MIYFIKKYWKYLSCIFIFLLMIAFSCFYYLKDNKVSTPSVNKLSLTKEQNEKTSTVFVDVKGAVNAPGVYELDDGRRVIDQTTTNMIQKLNLLFARNPFISMGI